MNRSLENVRCSRQLSDEIITKDWDSFTDADWARIASGGYGHASYVKHPLEDDSSYSTQYYLDIHLPEPEQGLETLIREVMEDFSCGNIFRIKGFLKTKQGGWLEINATRRNIRLEPIGNGQEVLIVIGEDLNKERIDDYFGKYKNT